jgi:hypothetical protein
MKRSLPFASVLILVSITFISTPKPAAATPPTLTVNSAFDVAADFTNDASFDICRTNVANSVCTLRAAMMNANRYVGGGVTIIIPAGTYRLTIPPSGVDDDSTGDLNITNTMTINGVSAASTAIDGNQTDRVFREGRGVIVTISNVTIRNGHVNDIGGGISNAGTLTLNDSVVSDNQTQGGSSGGGIANLGDLLTLNHTVVSGNQADGNAGGIYNDRSSTLVLNNSAISSNRTLNGGYGGGIANAGTATIDNSTVNNNETSLQANNPVSGYGGGIAHFSGTLSVTNSTISANGAHGNGGGIYHVGTLQLFHVTVAGNIADLDFSAAGLGGGIFSAAGANGNQVWNSLLVENYAANEPNDCGGGTLTSEDYNYIQTTGTAASCIITGTTTHDITGGDALLDTLRDNGGATSTRALLAGSPALDRIPPDLCRDAFGSAPTPDQRGVPRPVGPLCDIGAFEGELPLLGYNRNLVRNGDAEAAAGSPSGGLVGVPNWRAGDPQISMTAVPYGAPGGFPSVATDSVPAVHGANFFAGRESGVAVSIQDVDLSALATSIEAGAVRYNCSADLGGFLDQEDNATVEYDFLDQATHLLSQVILGPVTAADRSNQTGLLHRDATDLVPAQTRTVEVIVTLTRATGPYNDGYVDNVSLVLTPAACIGDCNADGQVAIDDIITMVNIAFSAVPVSECTVGDSDGDQQITIDEILIAVNNVLSGCGG